MFTLSLSTAVASAETLAAIDAEIQINKTIKADRGGLAAYNIYEGVTTSRIDRKIDILQAAGISKWFYEYSSGARNYDNFYSFTSLAGVTDTSLQLVTTASTQRLYRRGSSSRLETSSRLGAWWAPSYRGIEDTRNEQAVLAAWGSDLQRIYVIDVPAGQTLLGGIASPMEQNGEYRPGGAYQYYYNGAPIAWLKYALYAPDYVNSYSGAVASAQRVGQTMADDLGAHLQQLRWQELARSSIAASGKKASDSLDTITVRSSGTSGNYQDRDGMRADYKTAGLNLYWDRLATSQAVQGTDRSYVGVMLGQGYNKQTNTRDVENKTRAILGGLYALRINRPDSSSPSYAYGSLFYGGLQFSNSVPGETVGTGLRQDYSGTMLALTVEKGISLRQEHGWVLEPYVKFAYTAVRHSNFNDNVTARVTLKQGDSLQGGLGIEARRTLIDAAKRQSHYWSRLTFNHEFASPIEVDVAGDKAITAVDKNKISLNVGADLQLGRSYYARGEVTKTFGRGQGFKGNLALKYVW